MSNNDLSNVSLLDIISQMQLLQTIASRLPEHYDEINKQYEELRQELVKRFPPLGNSEELKLTRKTSH